MASVVTISIQEKKNNVYHVWGTNFAFEMLLDLMT